MKRLILLGIILLFAVGCVQYDEELWLNRDGSGRVKLLLGYRSNYTNTKELEKYSQLSGIHFISHSIYRKKEFVFYQVEFRFDSIEDFNKVNDRLSNADFYGKITLNKEKNGHVTFKRYISLGSIDQEEDGIDALFQEKLSYPTKWKYKLHVPWKIISANASKDNVDMDKKTVSWVYDTGYMQNKTQIMSVEMKKPFSLVAILIIIVGILLIGFTLIWLFHLAKKTHLLQRLHLMSDDEAPDQQ